MKDVNLRSEQEGAAKGGPLLPTERPLKEAAGIYAKRLILLLVVLIFNLILLATGLLLIRVLSWIGNSVDAQMRSDAVVIAAYIFLLIAFFSFTVYSLKFMIRLLRGYHWTAKLRQHIGLPDSPVAYIQDQLSVIITELRLSVGKEKADNFSQFLEKLKQGRNNAQNTDKDHRDSSTATS
jgi:hypothetical protein